jgi:hypothetical protein
MRSLIRAFSALVGGLILVAAPARAQTASPRQSSPAAAPTSASVDLSTVRKDIKALLTAQEKYYVNHNSYSRDIESLDFTPSDGVTLKFVETSQNAYSVSGIVTGQPGASCVMMIGRVSAYPRTAKGAVAQSEGGVLCDGDPPGI